MHFSSRENNPINLSMNKSINILKLSFFLALLLPNLLFAQSGTTELGGFIGFAQYQGDLAEDHIELAETLISSGIFFRVHLNDYLTLKAAYYNGSISGDDKNGTNDFQKNRGWRFSSKINEFALIGEWNILGINRIGKWRKFKPSFTPILFAGIATTKFNTTLTVPDIDADLFPEPGDKDSFFAIPIGIGVRYDFSKYTSLGGEIGWRSIFSDYLDDVSNNGEGSGKNDWYSFAGLNISILFGQWFYD